mgnify:CR=1 FL=1
MRFSDDPEIGVQVMEDYDINKALYEINWHLALHISERDAHYNRVEHKPNELKWLMEVKKAVVQAIQVVPYRFRDPVVEELEC